VGLVLRHWRGGHGVIPGEKGDEPSRAGQRTWVSERCNDSAS